MAFFSFSGTKLFIGGALAFKQTDFVAADFNGQTWTQIGMIESIGAYGDTANMGTFSTLGTRREYSYVTTFGSSATEIVMARDAADAGQIALIAAATNPNLTYAVKLEYGDAPVDGTPTMDRFIARFTPPAMAGGSNADIAKWTAQMMVSSNIVITPAAE